MSVGISRRSFLKSSVAATCTLVIGFRADGALATTSEARVAALNPFVKINADGVVTVVIKHVEMGQGTSTGLATLVAEELGVDLGEVAIEFAPSNPELYNNLAFGPFQGTGGSTSMANSFLQYRQAGAAAREMLLAAAAREWRVDVSQLTLKNGEIGGGGRSGPLSAFVAAAATLEPPANPPLKEPPQFDLIGNPNVGRRDNEPKVTGTAAFAMDKHVPGQMFAVIVSGDRHLVPVRQAAGEFSERSRFDSLALAAEVPCMDQHATVGIADLPMQAVGVTEKNQTREQASRE